MPAFEGTGRRLREDYSEIEDLRRALPVLILEHNLHGIDIDGRCAQIAALALWMRAQRAWQASGFSRIERPPVSRTHIIEAAPMPGDGGMVKAFAETLEPSVLGDLFVQIVEEMDLAGELGSLLPIEKTLANAVHDARLEFEAYQAEEREKANWLPGFAPESKRSEPQQLLFDFAGLDAAFFESAENRILDALRAYCDGVSGTQSVRRRLFALDAEQGVEAVDLLSRHYSAVLMNPPFGDLIDSTRKALDARCRQCRHDIDAAFVTRAEDLLSPRGRVGAIINRTQFFKDGLKDWRREALLGDNTIDCCADLGLGVLDGAMVEAAAYVVCFRLACNT